MVALMTRSDEEVVGRDRRLPARLHLAARPELRLDRRRARLRDRRRLPAGALVRPAGRRRRRPVLHEGARARAGARPDGNKAARRERWLRQGTGDLRDRAVVGAARGRRHRAGAGRRPRPTNSRRPSPTSSAALLAPMAGAVRETKALLQGAADRSLDDQRRLEREAQVRRFRELVGADGPDRKASSSVDGGWVRPGDARDAHRPQRGQPAARRRHGPPGARLRPAAPAADRGLPRVLVVDAAWSS